MCGQGWCVFFNPFVLTGWDNPPSFPRCLKNATNTFEAGTNSLSKWSFSVLTPVLKILLLQYSRWPLRTRKVPIILVGGFLYSESMNITMVLRDVTQFCMHRDTRAAPGNLRLSPINTARQFSLLLQLHNSICKSSTSAFFKTANTFWALVLAKAGGLQSRDWEAQVGHHRATIYFAAVWKDSLLVPMWRQQRCHAHTEKQQGGEKRSLTIFWYWQVHHNQHPAVKAFHVFSLFAPLGSVHSPLPFPPWSSDALYTYLRHRSFSSHKSWSFSGMFALQTGARCTRELAEITNGFPGLWNREKKDEEGYWGGGGIWICFWYLVSHNSSLPGVSHHWLSWIAAFSPALKDIILAPPLPVTWLWIPVT